MTDGQRILCVLTGALVTLVIRALPFVVFRGERRIPAFITWLGGQLPHAAMAMLLVYCMKDMDFSHPSGAFPMLLGTLVTVLVHVRFRQTMCSIVSGTAAYMLMIRLMP
ncbi:MAG: AzlD domain-containing protein [Clostridia bacterium]|nr:AzlD domain-containing protein [Clostridia bacterium]